MFSFGSQYLQGVEKEWYIPPTQGIPIYKAENDPFCPMAKVRKFNDEQKLKLKSAIKNQEKSESWVKKQLESNFQDKTVDIQSIINPNFIKKSISQSQFPPGSLTGISQFEIDILQKIVVRERLLTELMRLIRSSSEILSVIKETSEFIKALRHETLEIIESIIQWQQQAIGQHSTVRPFLYKGMNYLIKIAGDLNFLDEYDDIVEYFCFEFTRNPLAYRGGGHLITGQASNHSKNYLQGVLKSYYDSGQSNVDGIEVIRLHNAEKMIQGEFNRIVSQVQIFGGSNGQQQVPSSSSSSTNGGGYQQQSSLEDLATIEQSMFLQQQINDQNNSKKNKKNGERQDQLKR